MSDPGLARSALDLAALSADRLTRWLVLFDLQLADAEAASRAPELKDFAAFLTCLKRVLEIARLAGLLDQKEDLSGASQLDPEFLRKLLSDED